MGVIEEGTPAPAFRLMGEDGEAFTESDLKGRRTVFVFYPFAFSPVCTEQLQLYEPELAGLAGRGIKLYGVSCDASYSQTAFREKLSVTSPQLSDFEPKGAACRAFGVLHAGGFPERALVMIDGDGIVRFSYQADSPGELPGVDLLLEGVRTAFGDV
jgi:peroxiredoxin (alkyl hydroperoxide reductase subunit C)